jgi:hypothetical protein
VWVVQKRKGGRPMIKLSFTLEGTKESELKQQLDVIRERITSYFLDKRMSNYEGKSVEIYIKDGKIVTEDTGK